MIRAVFARELRGSLGALAVVSASLACCAVAIASMFSPETARMLEDLKAAMPELYDAFGMGNDTSTLTGFLLNYLYGFLLTLGPLALTLLAVSRSAVRPAATGELANVLASPHSKSSVAASIAPPPSRRDWPARFPANRYGRTSPRAAAPASRCR